MRFNDSITGGFFLALGIAIILLSLDFHAPVGQRFGPGLFPISTAAMMVIGGLGLVVKGWRARRTEAWLTLEDWWRSPRLVFHGAAVFGSMIVYLLLSEDLGFLIVATVILWCLIALLWGKPAAAMGIAASSAFVIHVFFVELLKVPLPWGIVPYFKLL